MKAIFITKAERKEKKYKTMRGINNFVNRIVENYDLRFLKKEFEDTDIEIWRYEGGAGWKASFHIHKS